MWLYYYHNIHKSLYWHNIVTNFIFYRCDNNTFDFLKVSYDSWISNSLDEEMIIHSKVFQK